MRPVEMRLFHWLLLFWLYLSQSLSEAFVFLALPVILRDAGLSLEKISLIYIGGVIWTLKFLWAPFMNRTRFGRFGHYKIWLIISQLGLFATVAALSATDNLLDNYALILAFVLCIAVLAATQDNAAGAVACRLLPKESHGAGGTVQVVGGMLGFLLGGGVVLILFDTVSWKISNYVVAAAVFVALIFIVRFDENELKGGTNERAASVNFARIVSFWRGDGMGRWAWMICTLPVCVTMTWAIANPMLVDMEVPIREIGWALHIVAPLVGLAVSLPIGFLMRRWRRDRIFMCYPVLQLVALSLLFAVVSGGVEGIGLYSALLAVYALDVLFFGLISAFAFGHVKAGSEAIDYSVQISLYGIVAEAVAVLSLILAGQYGYQAVILGCVAACAFFGVAFFALSSLAGKRKTG